MLAGCELLHSSGSGIGPGGVQACRTAPPQNIRTSIYNATLTPPSQPLPCGGSGSAGVAAPGVPAAAGAAPTGQGVGGKRRRHHIQEEGEGVEGELASNARAGEGRSQAPEFEACSREVLAAATQGSPTRASAPSSCLPPPAQHQPQQAQQPQSRPQPQTPPQQAQQQEQREPTLVGALPPTPLQLLPCHPAAPPALQFRPLTFDEIFVGAPGSNAAGAAPAKAPESGALPEPAPAMAGAALPAAQPAISSPLPAAQPTLATGASPVSMLSSAAGSPTLQATLSLQLPAAAGDGAPASLLGGGFGGAAMQPVATWDPTPCGGGGQESESKPRLSLRQRMAQLGKRGRGS